MVEKDAVKREFVAGLHDWKTLFVNPAVNRYLFRVREGCSERTGAGSAFPQLCPRYSGTLTPTAPTPIGPLPVPFVLTAF